MPSSALPKRLLLIKIRPDKLGDVLLATPVVRSLKEAYPELELTMWAHPWLLPLLDRNPYLAGAGPTSFRLSFAESRDHVRRMRSNFDAVVFLKDRAGSHIPPSFLAGIPRRIGSVKKSYGRFLSQNLDLEWDSQPVHEAELCYRLVELAFGIELERKPSTLDIWEQDVEDAKAALRLSGVRGGYFCLQTTTGATSAAWSSAGFVEVARRLTQELSCQCVLTGGPSDAAQCEAIACEIGSSSVSLAGQRLTTLASLLARSIGLISPSTGTMHVAATQQTPCVLIQLPPDTEAWVAKWHPWMSPY